MATGESRPFGAGLVAGLAVLLPASLWLLHLKLFGIVQPYGFVCMLGIAVAVVLSLHDGWKALSVGELLWPLVSTVSRRLASVGCLLALETLALTFGWNRRTEQQAWAARFGSNPCSALSIPEAIARDLDLSGGREVALGECAIRQHQEAEQAARAKCSAFVTAIARGDLTAPLPVGVSASLRDTLSRAGQGLLTLPELGLTKDDMTACDGGLWPIYVAGALRSPAAWAAVTTPNSIGHQLIEHVESWHLELKGESAEALLRSVEQRARQAPKSGDDDVSIVDLCDLASRLTRRASENSCAIVRQRAERTKAAEEAKQKVEAARAEAKRAAEDARAAAQYAATRRCLAGCDRHMGVDDERWGRCSDHCMGLDALDAPLF